MPTETFAVAILVTAAAGLAVLAASRLSERARVPLPAVVLVAAAVAVRLVPGLHAPHQTTAAEVVSLALVLVLFAGGMNIGLSRLRPAAGPILILGVAGTFGTAALAGVLIHYGFGFSWYVSLLVATAVSPTDPTVVFSVLGRRQVAGRSGTILEGESGANDPVGIALMAGLLGAGGLTGSGVGHAAWTFVLQMVVGTAVGVAGGRATLWLMRRVALPSEGLYPLRTLGAAFLIYGIGAAAHGSGFLAVFVAGIILGDERAPYKREVEHFQGALASLGEIVAFVTLGLTVNLHVLSRADTWGPGLALGAVLAFLIRPAVVAACLAGGGLERRERRFVQFAGLKGAVPILLGGYLLQSHVSDSARLYGLVIVVVVLSVVMQGGLVGPITRLLGLPVNIVEPEPWTFGVRLGREPENVHQFVVAPGSSADGAAVGSFAALPEGAWIAVLVRGERLLAVRGDTELKAGDRVTVLAGPEDARQLRQAFEEAATAG